MFFMIGNILKVGDAHGLRWCQTYGMAVTKRLLMRLLAFYSTLNSKFHLGVGFIGFKC